MSEETLRALIRYLGPLSLLREDLERTVHLELYPGVGDAVVQTYGGLHAAVTRLVDDPYLQGLTVNVPDGADDRQKVSLVLLLAGQLLAFVQSEVGVASLTQGSNTHVQTAPYVIVNAQGADPETARGVQDVVARALGEEATEG